MPFPMVQVQMGSGGSPRYRKVHARIAVPENLALAAATDAATRPPLPLSHRPPPLPATPGEHGFHAVNGAQSIQLMKPGRRLLDRRC